MRWKPGRSAEWNLGQPVSREFSFSSTSQGEASPVQSPTAASPPASAGLRLATPGRGQAHATSGTASLPRSPAPAAAPLARTSTPLAAAASRAPAAPVASRGAATPSPISRDGSAIQRHLLADGDNSLQKAALQERHHQQLQQASGSDTGRSSPSQPQPQQLELASVWVSSSTMTASEGSSSAGTTATSSTAVLAPPSRPSSPGSWASSNQQLVAAAAAASAAAPATHPPAPCCQKSCQCLSAVVNTLTALSFAASFGNITRLPRIAILDGGVPFLVAYAIVMLVLGIPLSFLEIGIGQFCHEGPIKLWRAVPLFRGVGYAKLFLCVLTGLYYSLSAAIALFYVVWSAKGPFPFSECVSADNNSEIGFPAEDCLQNTFLTPVQMDPLWFGILAALLFLFWIIRTVCICGSKQSYRVAASVLFLFIISVLAALLFESFLRDTDIAGLKEFLKVDWNSLLDFRVWYMALVQMFFSSHLGFASISTQAGIIYPKHSALWLSFSQILLSLIVGLASVVIAVLWQGQLTTSANIQTNEPFFSEVWFLTLAYTASTNVMSASEQIWAVFIFLAIVASGLLSVCSFSIAVTLGICGEMSKRCRWWQTVILTCFIMGAIGIPCFLLNELEFVHILDHYVTGRAVIALTALELIGLVWIYGSTNVYNDFEFLQGNRLNPLWKLMWYIIPVLLIAMEVASFVLMPLTGPKEMVSDQIWIYCTGWAVYAIVWVVIIAMAVRQVAVQVDYNLKQKLCSTLKPSRNWGPADTLYRHQWLRWREWSSKPGQPKDFSLKRQGTKDYTHSVVRNGSSLHVRPVQRPSMNGERTVMREPYKLETNGQEHVCWRGTASSNAT
ncbi:sodium-dependent nutrient amino acid transporter 1-like isoform X1 [Schistocerca nitens]|uniref:sodium-dependent nutrient amino acid transporter 1-like isoform X1 n=1 Tax=Schistocerca nitens TaxID=7011 RepID=UPI002117DC92|nr:sodium-dependent nutrient amino acid transporter 1-like isoform X1 [Schistocerca nitens]